MRGGDGRRGRRRGEEARKGEVCRGGEESCIVGEWEYTRKTDRESRGREKKSTEVENGREHER